MGAFTRWYDYPDVSGAVTVGHGSGGTYNFPPRSSGDNFTALADATSNTADGSHVSSGNTALNAPGAWMGYAGNTSSPTYSLDQLDVDINIAGIFGLDTWTPPLPWPAGAVGFQKEPVTVQQIIDNLSSLTLTFDVVDVTATKLPLNVPCDVTVIGMITPKTAQTYDLNGVSSVEWLPASALASPVFSVALPAATGSVTVTTANLVPASSFVFVTPLWASLHLTVAFDEQRTHTAPTGLNARAVGIDNLTITATITNNRYRFELAGLPPLRQFPRDDYLGGAPRQGNTNQPRSLQASSRQGWANSYR